jgi:tRNA-2-methylthio-N6-dimethylallyladenosine synthase
MKRRYTRADYLAMVNLARERIADVTFSGDFIVGFPGEAEEDFQQTLSLVREVGNDTIFAFKYSERPGVPAARLDDDVSEDDKKRRLAELMAVQDEVWSRLAAAQVGQEVTAIAEQVARRPDGHWRLRTANNRKIVVPLAATAPGAAHRVRITGWQNTSFHGVLLDC